MEQCSEMMHRLLSILHTFLSISPRDFKEPFKIFVPKENMSGNGMSKTSAKLERLHSCSVVSVPVQGRSLC